LLRKLCEHGQHGGQRCHPVGYPEGLEEADCFPLLLLLKLGRLLYLMLELVDGLHGLVFLVPAAGCLYQQQILQVHPRILHHPFGDIV